MPDKFQNFDIMFLVRQIRSFTIDHPWTDIFAGPAHGNAFW